MIKPKNIGTSILVAVVVYKNKSNPKPTGIPPNQRYIVHVAVL